MTKKVFSATMVIKVDSNNNVLGAYADAHEDDVHDLVVDTFYDLDDVEIENLTVKERR
jgi:hypothetical protein